MTRTTLSRRFPARRFLAALTLPLALGVAACGSNGGDAASGEKIEPIAAPAGQNWTEVVTTTPEGGYLMGNPDAPIKLVEYGSLSCPGCAKFAQEGYEELVNEFVSSGRVNFEFRSFAIHPQDIPLTVLAQCGSPEAFFPLTHQIYTNFEQLNAPFADEAAMAQANAASQLPPQQRMVALADALDYTEFFAQRGIAADQARACLTDTAKAEAVAQRAQEYSDAGITSTPTVLVNGTKVDGGSWADARQALIAAGAR